MNTVNNLLINKFSLLSFEEKLQIKQLGRCTPCLNIEQAVTIKNKSFKRTLKSSSYDKYKWLYGCNERNSLHCFPCLLFVGEDSLTKSM